MRRKAPWIAFSHIDIETPDPQGNELPSFEAAKARVLAEALEIIQASIVDHDKVDLRHQIDLRDESGAIVSSCTLRMP